MFVRRLPKPTWLQRKWMLILSGTSEKPPLVLSRILGRASLVRKHMPAENAWQQHLRNSKQRMGHNEHASFSVGQYLHKQAQSLSRGQSKTRCNKRQCDPFKHHTNSIVDHVPHLLRSSRSGRGTSRCTFSRRDKNGWRRLGP